MLLAAFPSIPGELVPESRREQMRGLAAGLPPVFDLIVLESRLDGASEQVDLLLGSTRPAPCLTILEDAFSTLELHQRGHEFIVDWCSSRGKQTDSAVAWFEFDVPVNGKPRLGIGTAVSANLFLGRKSCPSTEQQVASARAGYQAITGTELPHGLTRNLRRCIEQMPSGWSCTYIAPLDIRGSDLLRVVAIMPCDQIREWLNRIVWTGRKDCLDHLFEVVGRDRSVFGVQIEVGVDGVSDYLAVEQYFKGEAEEDDLDHALHRYKTAGISDAARSRSLEGWLQQGVVHLDEGARAHMHRSIVLKTTLAETGELSAKSYLEFFYQRAFF